MSPSRVTPKVRMLVPPFILDMLVIAGWSTIEVVDSRFLCSERVMQMMVSVLRGTR